MYDVTHRCPCCLAMQCSVLTAHSLALTALLHSSPRPDGSGEPICPLSFSHFGRHEIPIYLSTVGLQEVNGEQKSSPLFSCIKINNFWAPVWPSSLVFLAHFPLVCGNPVINYLLPTIQGGLCTPRSSLSLHKGICQYWCGGWFQML